VHKFFFSGVTTSSSQEGSGPAGLPKRSKVGSYKKERMASGTADQQFGRGGRAGGEEGLDGQGKISKV
jgi:hypothetical protein